MVLVQNITVIFQLFFLGNIGQENMFYNNVAKKNASLVYINKKFKMLKTCHFSKGVNPWFWSRNGHFSNFFFFVNIGQENFWFMIFQNETTPFLAIKTRSSKSRKMDIFRKGLTLAFGPKMAIFPTFFLSNICQENVFYDIVERKNAFLGYENEKFKRWKNGHFSKGVNPWFWSKNGHFSNFCFYSIQATKMFFKIFQNQNNAFPSYNNKKFKKLNN